MLARRRVFRRRIPTQRPRRSQRALPLGKEFDRRRVKEASLACAGSSGENLAGKAQQVGHIGKQTGVTGHASKKPGVFILDFSLNHAMAEGCVLLGGRNEAEL